MRSLSARLGPLCILACVELPPQKLKGNALTPRPFRVALSGGKVLCLDHGSPSASPTVGATVVLCPAARRRISYLAILELRRPLDAGSSTLGPVYLGSPVHSQQRMHAGSTAMTVSCLEATRTANATKFLHGPNRSNC